MWDSNVYLKLIFIFSAHMVVIYDKIRAKPKYTSFGTSWLQDAVQLQAFEYVAIQFSSLWCVQWCLKSVTQNILGFILYITGFVLQKKKVHFYAVFIQVIFTMAVTWSTEHNSLGSFLLNFPWSFLYWNGYLFMDRRVTHAFVFLSSQHNYFFFVQARFRRCVCGLHLQ